MPAKSKKPKKAIDLSSELGVGERGGDFVVQLYDYHKLQSGFLEEDAQFESDLQYLLSSQESIVSVSKKSLKKKAKKATLNEEPKARIKRRSVKTKMEEITGDMNEIVLSSEDESDVSTTIDPNGVKPGKSAKKVKAEKSSGPATPAMAQSPDNQKEASEKSGNDDVLAGRSPIDTARDADEAEDKKKPKKKKRPKKTSSDRKASPDLNADSAEMPETTPSPSRQRQQTAPRKISAAQVSSTILPEKEPVSTIIGLSPQQIITMKPTDVKFKIIMNVQGMLKMCRNVLDFVSRETNGIFANESTKDSFVELCVHVALREAKGFQDVSKKCPDLMAQLGEVKELTLEHTKTSYTESHKRAHQNNFDYTVFSYIGHILIWASWLQRKEKKKPILEGLGFTEKDVIASLGGCHLWDRIRRDPQTINMKRWKHIQKFRQNYAFEEHQFIVILRLMHLGSTLC